MTSEPYQVIHDPQSFMEISQSYEDFFHDLLYGTSQERRSKPLGRPPRPQTQSQKKPSETGYANRPTRPWPARRCGPRRADSLFKQQTRERGDLPLIVRVVGKVSNPAVVLLEEVVDLARDRLNPPRQ